MPRDHFETLKRTRGLSTALYPAAIHELPAIYVDDFIRLNIQTSNLTLDIYGLPIATTHQP